MDDFTILFESLNAFNANISFTIKAVNNILVNITIPYEDSEIFFQFNFDGTLHDFVYTFEKTLNDSHKYSSGYTQIGYKVYSEEEITILTSLMKCIKNKYTCLL